MNFRFLAGAALALSFATAIPAHAEGPTTILNASYDIGRELYAAIDTAFVSAYADQTGETVTVDQSHGGTSRQARAILEGLEADVVTFNQVTDIQVLHDRGNLVSADWQSEFPHNSSPYYSLPAFLVRAGNPKGIKDWSDLVRDDVEVVFPNPKTSGNARYTYLAAYAFALDQNGGDQEKAQEFIGKLFDNVPVFDTGGRASTTTFVEAKTGDVLITFEAEVRGIQKEYGPENFEIVIPSMSILAEFPVAIVDSVADKRGSRDLAKAYLDYLYTPEAQRIIATYGNRVRDESVAAEFKDQFPEVKLVTVEDVFGGWAKITEEHFSEGGILDQLYGER